jgi:hypothetical protein
MRRLVSILSLAAVVTLACSTFGAGVASADRLCLTALDPCPAASIVPSGTAFTTSLTTTPATFADASGSGTRFFCGGSTWAATTTSAGGNFGVPVTFSIASGGFTLTPCNSFVPTGCSLSVTSGTSGSFIASSSVSPPNGVISVLPPTISFRCPPATYTCIYSSATVPLTGVFTSGTYGPTGTSQITFTSQRIPLSSGPPPVCPTAMRFDATYRVTRVGASSFGTLAMSGS